MSLQPQCFLLLQHHNRWDLPKGHVEPGEDLIQAALRETTEETGIDPDSIRVDNQFKFVIEYCVQTSKRGSYSKRVTYFLGWMQAPLPIHLTEHIGYRWFDWPVAGSIQSETIDPLLTELAVYLKQANGPNN